MSSVGGTPTIAALGMSARRSARHLPAGTEFTGFVLFDLFLFSTLFLSYVYDRSKQVDLFCASQQALNASVGAVNTIILLTSSWFVVVAIHMARQGRGKHASRIFSAAIGCGALFMVLKGFEYAAKFRAGLSMLSNDFYMYYFVLTGFHGLHVLIGMLLLAICASRARTAASCQGQVPLFDKCGTYWHVVDVIWIMLYPLLYLAR